MFTNYAIMDSLLESAKTYLEVLQISKSDKVASWKTEDLERAVNWAEYFKRVQSRIQKKITLAQKFDAQLKEIGLHAGIRFGQQELSSEFLGQSLHYLITTLLENPSLPLEIRQFICQKYANSTHQTHIEKVSNVHTLLTTLLAVHSKLATCIPANAPLIGNGNPLLLVDAMALQEEVQWILSQPPHLVHSSPQGLPQTLHKKLEDLVELEHGIEVLVLSTIPRATRTLPSTSAVGLHSENTNSAAQIILQWLEQRLRPTHGSTNASITEKFWSLSPHLLASVSAQNVNFFCIYFKLLASKVDRLQDEVVQEFEDPTQQLQHTYLDKLEKEALSHFRGLLAAGSNVRDITVALVASQIEETAAKLSLTSSTAFTSESTAIRYPVNLWRKVLN